MRIVTVVVVLLFCPVIHIHAGGAPDMKKEAQLHEELKRYPVTVAPISLPGTIAYDYVFIDADRLILVESLQLTEINLSTGEQKTIEIPEEWAKKRGFLSFRELQYDKTNNSVHMILDNREPGYGERTYHILCLDDYSWDTIEELGNQIQDYYYDAISMLIYIYHRFVIHGAETGYSRYITTYDLQKKEIVEQLEVPNDTHSVYCLYLHDNQPKMLASTRSTQMNWGLHFFIYDIHNRTRVDFPESIINMDTDFFSLHNYIPLNENGCFLSVASKVRNKSSIAVMNLINNTVETVALDEFPYEIYGFKQITEGRYSMLVTYSPGPKALCFLDLDIASKR